MNALKLYGRAGKWFLGCSLALVGTGYVSAQSVPNPIDPTFSLSQGSIQAEKLDWDSHDRSVLSAVANGQTIDHAIIRTDSPTHSNLETIVCNQTNSSEFTLQSLPRESEGPEPMVVPLPPAVWMAAPLVAGIGIQALRKKLRIGA